MVVIFEKEWERERERDRDREQVSLYWCLIWRYSPSTWLLTCVLCPLVLALASQNMWPSAKTSSSPTTSTPSFILMVSLLYHCFVCQCHFCQLGNFVSYIGLLCFLSIQYACTLSSKEPTWKVTGKTSWTQWESVTRHFTRWAHPVLLRKQSNAAGPFTSGGANVKER